MSPAFESAVLRATGARSMEVAEVIQELWSGYGQILRLRLEGTGVATVIAKHVRIPTADNHPRGWDTGLSQERKIRSYQVETAWYRDWSGRCDALCRVPGFLAYEEEDGEVFLLLEDLDAAGFPGRMGRVGWRQVECCLEWLGHFHATFLGVSPEGLWEVGTYWHLATRPDELEVLDDLDLKGAAAAIDQRLSWAKYRTLVHGDAKLANFCFSENGEGVAAVDFQYVGGGCGMKDVAYFVGSCLDEASCEAREEEVLDAYFAALREGLERRGADVDVDDVCREWRALYRVAWTDFHRFIKGWSPGHWKITGYSERVAREVIAGLGD